MSLWKFPYPRRRVDNIDNHVVKEAATAAQAQEAADDFVTAA